MTARLSNMEEVFNRLSGRMSNFQFEFIASTSPGQPADCGLPHWLENMEEHLEKRLILLERVFVVVVWQALELAIQVKCADPNLDQSGTGLDANRSIVECNVRWTTLPMRCCSQC